MSLDVAEIRRLIAAGEGSRVEFKRGLPRAEKVARTLAAFANTRGGHLLVGVGDRGEVLGAPHPARTVERLRAIAAEQVDPPLAPSVARVAVGDLPVVVVAVGLSDARPHRVEREDGRVEVPTRIGSSTRAARGPALEAIRRGAAGGGRGGLTPLERQVLAWVGAQGDAGTSAAGRSTPKHFAAAHNVGAVRAQRAFVKLERAGRLVGFGDGAGRSYALP